MFAQRLSRSKHTGNADVVTLGFVLAIGRPPTPEELRLTTPILGDGSVAEIIDFCRVLLCLNEFLYIE